MYHPALDTSNCIEILDLLSIGALVVDRDLRVAKWNLKLAEWTGIAPAKACGARLTQLYTSLCGSVYEQRLNDMFATGLPVSFSASLHHHFLPIRPRHNNSQGVMEQQTEARLLAKDSNFALITIQDVSLQYLHIQQLQQERAELVATQQRMQTAFEWLEITNSNLRATERKLRESQAYTENIFLSLTDMLLVVDQQGIIRQVNQATCDTLGYLEKELVGNDFSIFYPTHYKSKANHQGQQLRSPHLDQWTLHELFEKGILTKDDIYCRARDGSNLSVSCSASVLRYPAERKQRAVILMKDISATKRIQAELIQAQKMESLGQLAAGVAHEINTPMQCVASNVDYLEISLQTLFDIVDECHQLLCSPPDTWNSQAEGLLQRLENNQFVELHEEAPAAVREAASALHRAIDIVRAMKALSNPGTKHFITTNLNEIVRDAIALSANRWKHCSTLKANLCSNLPACRALPGEIIQVILHLLVNAGDALGDKFEQTGVRGTIHVRTLDMGDHLVVEVEDSGDGIPAGLRQRIFEPFFTTKEVGKGTGQGLAVCYQSIARHRGSIEVHSQEGEGTTFVVRLPLNPDTALSHLTCQVNRPG